MQVKDGVAVACKVVYAAKKAVTFQGKAQGPKGKKEKKEGGKKKKGSTAKGSAKKSKGGGSGKQNGTRTLFKFRVMDETAEVTVKAWGETAKEMEGRVGESLEKWVVLTQVGLVEYQPKGGGDRVVELGLGEESRLLEAAGVPVAMQDLAPKNASFAEVASADMYTRVYLKARVTEVGGVRKTQNSSVFRVAKLLEFGGGKEVLPLRVFGDVAKEEAWCAGAMIQVKNGMRHKDCVKIDDEATVCFLETEEPWSAPAGQRLTFLRFSNESSDESGSESSSR